MIRTCFFALLLTFSLNIGAQTFTPERTAGIYYAYPVTESARVCPEGYTPFYISHYGRHGSRWLPSEERYTWVMAWFVDKSKLTSFGKSVRRRLVKICHNAHGKAGALTPLGATQQRGIARRMVLRFPEVFDNGRTRTDISGNGTRILARSSTSPRCRASMLAFCEQLNSFSPLSPRSSFTIETRPEDMAYI
ncbi:MAG: histidine-type phosphatase, partial [Prevotella sp.]|nr:histidine-type phosphatase [Prevotella sp.]